MLPFLTPCVHASIMKYIATLLLLCLLLPFFSGCTAESEAPPEIPAPSPTPVPATPVESPVIILPPALATVPTTLSASPLTQDNALYLTLEINARGWQGQIPTEGYPLMLTFFVYNSDQFEPGYTPSTADEVRDAGIPYKTRSLHIYSQNILTHNEQVPQRGSPAGLFSPGKPYVYGVIIDIRPV